jgi:hypothetical protein
MGWEFCNTKHIKKTKKPHCCSFCGRTIEAGTSNILNWSGKYDGDFQNSYACHWCEDNQKRLIDDHTNEIMDFGDCLTEDIFQSELEPVGERVYFETEGDYFVFKTHSTNEEVLRVKCPTNRESA